MRDFLHNLSVNHYAAAAVLLFSIGMAGLIFNRNLVKKIVSMGFMDDGIFLFLTSLGYIHGAHAPIQEGEATVMFSVANPVPAGLVLTGIVVSCSVTAFSLALTSRLYKRYHTLDIDEIMEHIRRDEL